MAKKATIQISNYLRSEIRFPDSRWDSMPETFYTEGRIVKITANGEFEWGPFKYRRNEKKEYQGVSQIALIQTKTFLSEYYDDGEPRGNIEYGKEILDDYDIRAQDYAISQGIHLEEKGYEVSIGEYSENDLKKESKLEWIANKPPKWVIKRMTPKSEWDSYNYDWPEYRLPVITTVI